MTPSAFIDAVCAEQRATFAKLDAGAVDALVGELDGADRKSVV